MVTTRETKVTACVCYACTQSPTDEQVARAKAYWSGKVHENEYNALIRTIEHQTGKEWKK